MRKTIFLLICLLLCPSLKAQNVSGANASGNLVFSGNVNAPNITPRSTATVSPFDYGFISDAVTLSPCDLSGGGTTLVCTGLITASMLNKVGTCLLNNDFGSFGNGTGQLFTITAVSPPNSATINRTILRAFANQACPIASVNLKTSLDLAQAAVPNGGTIQMPCGNGNLYSGGQIFSSFALVPSGGIVNIAGCPQKGTTIITDYSSVNTNTTQMMVTPAGVTVFFHDIVFQPVGYQNGVTFNTGAASSLNNLFAITSGHAENVEFNGWAAGSYTGTGAGFSISNDGSTWRCISSASGNGLRVFNRGVNLLQDCNSNPGALIVEGQEDGNVFTGGTYTKITVNSNTNASTVTFNGVNCNSSANVNCLVIGNATAPENIVWIGGRIGGQGNNVCQSNSGGATIGTNVVFHAFGVRFDSCGTGNSISNSGSFWDIGSYPVLVGAAYYTGTGTWNGKTTLSGAAYTNATTGFTNVVGGSGQTFQWNVQPNQFLNLSCHVYYQAAATGGLNIEFTGPASPTTVVYGLDDPSAATTFNSSVATAYSTSLGQAVGTATTNFDATVSFAVQNGTTGGTINLLAKSSAAATLTIQPGSFCQSQ